MPVHLGSNDWEAEHNRKAPLCPVCGAQTRVKAGPYGEFYSCSRFPDCKGKVTVTSDGEGDMSNEDLVEKMIRELYGDCHGT